MGRVRGTGFYRVERGDHDVSTPLEPEGKKVGPTPVKKGTWASKKGGLEKKGESLRGQNDGQNPSRPKGEDAPS